MGHHFHSSAAIIAIIVLYVIKYGRTPELVTVVDKSVFRKHLILRNKKLRNVTDTTPYFQHKHDVSEGK